MGNQNNKITTFSEDNFEAYVPTPMASSQQYNITSEFSNMVPSNNLSSIVNENIIPITQVQQTGILKFNITISVLSYFIKFLKLY